MASKLIDDHITKSYNRWLDYARYHASLASIAGQAEDVLNEVLIQLLAKKESFLEDLLSKKSGGYTELDFYILKMIKLNSHSKTSPYRHKYRTPLIDQNKDWTLLELEEIPYEDNRS